MDFLKKGADALKGNSSSSSSQQTTNNPGAGAAGQPAQKDDYVDKAFAFGSKKSGYNIDRSMQEKITDGGREAYEKATGKKVSEKISN